MTRTLHIFTDGGARGNPGPAGIGGVLKDAGSNALLDSFACYLGERTNNQAEYEAVLEALRRAQALGATTLHFFLDSQLVAEQLHGRYKVKNGDLRRLHARAVAALAAFPSVTFTHIPRAQNKEADRFVNQAIDEGLGVQRRTHP